MKGRHRRMARILAAAVCVAAALGGSSARAEMVRSGGSDVTWLEDGPGHSRGDYAGPSGLLRTETGVWMFVDVDMTPGSVTTIWWVIFNEPRICAFPTDISRCSLDDLATDATKPSFQYATGSVGRPDGVIQAFAFLSRGSTEGCPDGFPCNGLLDPMEADIHLVVRSHGALDPGHAAEQLRAYDGGCSATNPCANVQAAVHQSVRQDVRGDVSIIISNIRYCRSHACSSADVAYARRSSGAVAAYNPQGIIDVRPGDIVTWVYQDAWCDIAGFVPNCPGHNVVFEDGSVRSPLLPARSVEAQTFSWRVPDSLPSGTIIPYYCSINNHYQVGMTGALRVA